MNNDSQPVERIDKGKARAAEPSERTPLLANGGSSSLSPFSPSTPLHSARNSRRRLCSVLTLVFLVSLCFTLIACAVFFFEAFKAAASPDNMRQSLIFRGPDGVDVLNVTDDGTLWITVEARVGIDAGTAIDVNSDPGDWMLVSLWKAIGRWGVRRVSTVTVIPQPIDVRHKEVTLTTLDMSPMTIPLTTNPPRDASWLTSTSIPLRVKLTPNTTALVDFVRESWASGYVDMHISIPQVAILAGAPEERWWRHLLHFRVDNIIEHMHQQIPPLPGLPEPGGSFPPLADLVTLETFGVASGVDGLQVQARVSVVDPVPPELHITTPPIPALVSLATSEALPVAAVTVWPFTLTHPNITVQVSGAVLPATRKSVPALADFLTRYLGGKSTPVVVTLSHLLDSPIPLDFPAPNPRPEVLHDLTIRNMKVTAYGTSFLASGEILAHVVLPPGMDIALEVTRVLPDVLVFDGEVPGNSTDIPDPLPDNAFGHMKPDDWLPATSTRIDAEDGSEYLVMADIVDVPVEVLPGRQKQFSNFVGKVIFGSGGALAGILGDAAVGVQVAGLSKEELPLAGLPFKSSVRVGKNI
ncbi:hypothetical protein FISHEDRAFT_68233 [Fistulina hepatica ATCC 64428]|uniref:Transmembrane protein n=1 Tax=Fistulina hepatica ATCC 64428 TaxID=1128425 RepID=A0A0D7A0Q0_9AGAR|nr:hypothetical protein FISHEDRAFT_68233 [Fistulina hepatica ATCC 64428]